MHNYSVYGKAKKELDCAMDEYQSATDLQEESGVGYILPYLTDAAENLKQAAANFHAIINNLEENQRAEDDFDDKMTENEIRSGRY